VDDSEVTITKDDVHAPNALKPNPRLSAQLHANVFAMANLCNTAERVLLDYQQSNKYLDIQPGILNDEGDDEHPPTPEQQGKYYLYFISVILFKHRILCMHLQLLNIN
jgi:hypothetical protein